MKTFFISILIALPAVVFSQEFTVKFSIALPDTLTFQQLEWMDADNDGLLDIATLATNSNNESVICFFKNDSLRQLEFSGHINTGVVCETWMLSDFDGDNSVDITVSGYRDGQPVTAVFLNEGTFSFRLETLFSTAGRVIESADFNGDGFRELLISGRKDGVGFLHIMQYTDSGWVLVNDSVSLEATSVETLDIDTDNDIDFLVSGRDSNGAVVSQTYYNQTGFYFTDEDVAPPVEGVTTSADLNNDGLFDVLLAGKDVTNEDRLFMMLNHQDGFTVKDSLPSASAPKIFAADLTSNGSCDISIFGFTAAPDTMNVVVTADTSVSLVHSKVITQAFGDGEQDGDLDLAQLTKSVAGYGLRVLENTAPENNPPAAPALPVWADIFNRLFLYWEKPVDDHTTSNSITYDVSVQSTGVSVMTPHFDMLNGRRLTVSHGNNGTSNYVLLRRSTPGPIGFSVQAVDNALYGGIGGVCNGGGQPPCLKKETVDLELCRNETVRLESEETAHWFSFRDGFIEDAKALEFTFQEADTIFSLHRGPDCIVIRIYTLSQGDSLTKVVESTDFGCAGSVLHLGVEPGWEQVIWSGVVDGFLSNDDSIEYAVTVPDTITVTLSDGSGCLLQRKTAINISKPLIASVHDAYQIVKGQSVTLNVTGGSNYRWVPSSSLNDPQAANPVATPLRTTEYTVVASDSLGCTATLKVVVIVEETAFVPNLFTPNHDGANDVLKIYGLGSVTGFSFAIYNREGNKVYETKDPGQAQNNGWNGTYAGAEQPSGVYYWSIQGETSGGKPLRLNGKISGSIVLVR